MHLLPLGEAKAEWAEERPAREPTSLGVWAFMGEKVGHLIPDPGHAFEWTGRRPGRETCPWVRARAGHLRRTRPMLTSGTSSPGH